MQTEFDPVTHIGKVNGLEWPSVTQLLTEFKLQDFSNVPVERLEYKRILGTRVHAAINLLESGDLDEDHFEEHFSECVPYLNAYRKFREIEGFERICGEVRLFSKKWRTHGAFDFIGVNNDVNKYAGRLIVIDYKCVWQLYESTGPQTAAYEILAMENASELEIPKELRRRKALRFGLQLNKNGNYELKEYKDPQDHQLFMACAMLHWAKRERFKTTKGVVKQ